MDRIKRPTSVTVICWVIISLGGAVLLTLIQYIYYPLEEIRAALRADGRTLAGAIMSPATLGMAMLIMGIAMLKGMNWSRLLFLGFVPVSMVVSLLLRRFQLNVGDFISALLYLVFLYYLTRPSALEFFRGRDRSP